jgi:hypothetical protein
MWKRVVYSVNTKVSVAHLASFFRKDCDILEDGVRNTHDHKNLFNFCLRVIKFSFFERVCMCVLSRLIGFASRVCHGNCVCDVDLRPSDPCSISVS